MEFGIAPRKCTVGMEGHCSAPICVSRQWWKGGQQPGARPPTPFPGGAGCLGIPVKCSLCHRAHSPSPTDTGGAGTTSGQCPVSGCWVQWLAVLEAGEEDERSQHWWPNPNLQGTAMLPQAGPAGRAAGKSRRLPCNGWNRTRKQSEIPFPKSQMRLSGRGYP